MVDDLHWKTNFGGKTQNLYAGRHPELQFDTKDQVLFFFNSWWAYSAPPLGLMGLTRKNMLIQGVLDSWVGLV